MDILRFSLPYPPSVNHYYIRGHSSRVILSSKAKNYRSVVSYECLQQNVTHKVKSDMRLAVTINVFPPDKRKRDLDNILKGLWDSLQFANVICDDNQIDMLSVTRRNVVDGGSIALWITECSSSA